MDIEGVLAMKRRKSCIPFMLLPCLCAVLLSAGCASREQANCILITVHSLRPDHLSCYGYERPTSPCMDSLAGEGILFEKAYSASSLSPPSVGSLLTGTLPIFHGVRTCGEYALEEDLVTLTEIFKNEGFQTAAIVGSPFLEKRYGFQQGFDFYLDHYPEITRIKGEGVRKGQRKGKDLFQVANPSLEGRRVLERALDWLEKNRKSPFFLWIHFFDLNPPFAPPPPYNTAFPSPFMEYDFSVGDQFYWTFMNHPLKVYMYEKTAPKYLNLFFDTRAKLLERMVALYDGTVHYLDSLIGELVKRTREMGIFNQTCVVVTGDHGVSLGEKEEFFHHGWFAHDACIRIPLIFRLPQGEGRGERVKPRVRNIDIAPSLVNLFRLPGSFSFQGEGILGNGGEVLVKRDLPVYSEAMLQTMGSELFGPVRVYMEDQWKLVRKDAFVEGKLKIRNTLYDLSADPSEDLNLAEMESFKSQLSQMEKGLLELEKRWAWKGEPRQRIKDFHSKKLESMIESLKYKYPWD